MAHVTLSDEQKLVIEAVAKGNVVCDSIAGSGKTTTILGIANAYPNQQFLLLTYNQRLKAETRLQALQLGIHNIEVHSYHSCAVKYIDSKCRTDDGICDALDSNLPLKRKVPSYDVVVLDEAQDMTPLYYRLVCTMLRETNSDKIRICILGDRFQSIFKYNMADERYIIFAEELFPNTHTWQHLRLSTTYRLNDKMCNFVNKSVLGYERMHAAKKSDHKVRYIVCDCFSGFKYNRSSKSRKPGKRPMDSRTLEEVEMYLRSGYSCQDIFVIAPSVKSESSPVRLLANLVSTLLQIPIFVPLNDHDKLDDDIVKGKMVFSTFHQVKGLERKVVIVMGFDDSYSKFYKRGQAMDVCPNELYVAITRASERMSLFHHCTNDFLEFLDIDSMDDTCRIENADSIQVKRNRDQNKTRRAMAVTDLTRHMPYNILNKALDYLTVTEVQPPDAQIMISTKSTQGELCENIAEITGTAIPAYFAYLTKGFLPLDGIPTPTQGKLTPSKLLELCNTYCAKKCKYVFKTNQIQDYEWLSQKDLDECMERLHVLLPTHDDLHFEADIRRHVAGIEIRGFADLIDLGTNTVWEFKCEMELTKVDMVQLAVYAHLTESKRKPRKYKLCNILSNQVYEITFDPVRLGAMVEMLVWYKHSPTATQTSDEAFLQANDMVRTSVEKRVRVAKPVVVEVFAKSKYGGCML